MPRDVFLPDPDDADALVLELIFYGVEGPKRDLRTVEYRCQFRGDPLADPPVTVTCSIVKDTKQSYRVSMLPGYARPHCTCPYSLHNPESPKLCKHSAWAVAAWAHFTPLRQLYYFHNEAALHLPVLGDWSPGDPRLPFDDMVEQELAAARADR